MGTPPPPWYSPNSDNPYCYFNACSNNIYVTVPNNYQGGLPNYQYPRTGNAYIGLFYKNANDWRNYLQVKLSAALRQGKKYYAEHYVNKPEGMGLACNNIGMLFTNTAVYVDTINYPYGVLAANPQVLNYGNPVISDTQNWVKVSGVFKANGGEQYLTLGNFKYDANTVFKYVNINGYYGAAYNVDDVAVYELDSFCLKADAGRDTTIAQGDSVFIGSLTNGIDSIKWLQNGLIPIDSAKPGFWVKPTTTTTYILQQIVNGCYSADTVVVNVNSLPLTMLGFSAIYQPTPSPSKEGNVLLQWQTANEVNVSHFNIQRSVNGSVFTTIGKISANNKSLNDYRYTDYRIPWTVDGGLYYRIESVDEDGKKQYSETRTLNFKSQTLNGVSIYPNPAKDVVNIYCKEGIKEIRLLNSIGREMYRCTRNGDNVHQLSFNIQDYPKGLYLLSIYTAKGAIKTEKLIVQ